MHATVQRSAVLSSQQGPCGRRAAVPATRRTRPPRAISSSGSAGNSNEPVSNVGTVAQVMQQHRLLLEAGFSYDQAALMLELVERQRQGACGRSCAVPAKVAVGCFVLCKQRALRSVESMAAHRAAPGRRNCIQMRADMHACTHASYAAQAVRPPHNATLPPRRQPAAGAAGARTSCRCDQSHTGAAAAAAAVGSVAVAAGGV